MDIQQALQIVIDLARENTIDDPDMKEQQEMQRQAINIVEDMTVNHFADD